MILEILAAAAGTAAFSNLFGVPGKYWPYCGVVGGAGWMVNLLAESFTGQITAVFAAAVMVAFLSRLMAVIKHCPATVFCIPGIFLLVPGIGIYWTVYYLVTDCLSDALYTGYCAVQMAVAIVLGIVLVFEIPQKFFERLGNLS